MHKAIIICQNPFQTMTAIIIRRQQLQDRICDILITDRSSDMDRRARRLRETGIFRNVFFVQTKPCWSLGTGLRHHIAQTKCILCGCHLPIMSDVPDDYDEIYTLFVNCVVNELVQKMHRRGIEPAISLVEEGFGCYIKKYRDLLFGNRKRAVFEKFRCLFHGGKAPVELIKKFYLYKPELLMWDPPVALEKIERPDLKADPALKEIINRVFEYDGEAKYFENKVTFFEGADYQDTGDDRDRELIVDLAKMVGTENVVIKLHPRTQVNRFEQYGITTTDKLGLRQGVPWEVIAMNMEEDANCVFVSVNSGAVITCSFLFEKRYHAILMIKCLGGSGSADDDERMRFLERYAEAMPEVLSIPNDRKKLKKTVATWAGGE